jgi:hypothetical protein
MKTNVYDYREALKDDIREWVSENYSLDALRPQLAFYWDEMLDKLESQMRAQVTGSDIGSYTCDAWQAEENLYHNLSLLEEASRDFDIQPDLSNPEACDVLIREHEFDFVFASVMDEIKFRGL